MVISNFENARIQMKMNSADQFEAIVSEHYEPLFRFAMSLTRVESDAWDLTQQTFYIWATKGHQLRDVTKVKTSFDTYAASRLSPSAAKAEPLCPGRCGGGH